MGVFGGIKEAKYSEGGVYLKTGVFALEIQAVKYLRTRTGKDAFVAEFKIEESSNTELPVGGLVSWMVTLDKEPALGNIKQFLSSAIPCDEGSIDESVVEYAIGKDNPMAGRKVRASAINIKTKAGRDFTKVKYMRHDIGAAAAAAEHAKNG